MSPLLGLEANFSKLILVRLMFDDRIAPSCLNPYYRHGHCCCFNDIVFVGFVVVILIDIIVVDLIVGVCVLEMIKIEPATLKAG